MREACRSTILMSEMYTFVCDPDNCDGLIEFHASDGFGYPNGEVKMTCPCGRGMQYIGFTQIPPQPGDLQDAGVEDEPNL